MIFTDLFVGIFNNGYEVLYRYLGQFYGGTVFCKIIRYLQVNKCRNETVRRLSVLFLDRICRFANEDKQNICLFLVCTSPQTRALAFVFVFVFSPFVAMKQCPIATRIAGSIGILVRKTTTK